MYLLSAVVEQWARTSCPGKYLPPPKFCDSPGVRKLSVTSLTVTFMTATPVSEGVPSLLRVVPQRFYGPNLRQKPNSQISHVYPHCHHDSLGEIMISFRLFWEFTINLKNLYRRQNYIFWCFSTRGTNHPTFVLGHIPISTLSIYLCGYLLSGPWLSWL